MGSLVEERTEQLVLGFSRKLVPRKSGVSKGYLDIYVFAPDGTRLRSRVELKRYLKSHATWSSKNVDVDAFFDKPVDAINNKQSPVKIIPQGTDSFKVLNSRSLSKKQRDMMANQLGMGKAAVALSRCSESPEVSKLPIVQDDDPPEVKIEATELASDTNDDEKDTKMKEKSTRRRGRHENSKLVNGVKKERDGSKSNDKVTENGDDQMKSPDSKAEKKERNARHDRKIVHFEPVNGVEEKDKEVGSIEEPDLSFVANEEVIENNVDEKESSDTKAVSTKTKEKSASRRGRHENKVGIPNGAGKETASTDNKDEVIENGDNQKESSDSKAKEKSKSRRERHELKVNDVEKEEKRGVKGAKKKGKRLHCHSPEEKNADDEKKKKLKLMKSKQISDGALLFTLSQNRVVGLPKMPKIRRLSEPEKAMLPESSCEYKSPLEPMESPEPDKTAADLEPVTDTYKKEEQAKEAEVDLKEEVQTEAAEETTVESEDLSGDEEQMHFLDVTVPTAPMSPYHLVYEQLAGEPWKVLMASMLMTSASAVTCNGMVVDFFGKFPTLESICKEDVAEFLEEVGSVPLRNHLASEIEATAKSLIARVGKLEDVAHCTKYSVEVFRIFCLQKFGENDTTIPSYDLRSYVKWRLANNA